MSRDTEASSVPLAAQNTDRIIAVGVRNRERNGIMPGLVPFRSLLGSTRYPPLKVLSSPKV